MSPEDIGRILDEIGERIGPAGERAWQVAVQHTAISAWITVLGPLAVMLITLPLTIFYGRKVDFNAEGPGFNGVMMLIMGSITFSALLMFTMMVGTALPDALVPEWGAIRRIIEAAP